MSLNSDLNNTRKEWLILKMKLLLIIKPMVQPSLEWLNKILIKWSGR